MSKNAFYNSEKEALVLVLLYAFTEDFAHNRSIFKFSQSVFLKFHSGSFKYICCKQLSGLFTPNESVLRE